LQGGFALHSKILSELGIESVPVKKSSHLESIEGLIIPGGESSTISLLIESNELFDPIKHFSQHNPVMGTCAGLIMMSKRCNDKRIRTFGLLDVYVSRNAYGRQIYSEKKLVDFFFGDIKIKKVPTTLIRAPQITKLGKNLLVLGSVDSKPIAILNNHFLGLTFHPELDGIKIFHEVLFNPNSKVYYKKISKGYET
jgi:5'-phosphate synthase pdxT subunit